MDNSKPGNNCIVSISSNVGITFKGCKFHDQKIMVLSLPAETNVFVEGKGFTSETWLKCLAEVAIISLVSAFQVWTEPEFVPQITILAKSENSAYSKHNGKAEQFLKTPENNQNGKAQKSRKG